NTVVAAKDVPLVRKRGGRRLPACRRYRGEPQHCEGDPVTPAVEVRQRGKDRIAPRRDASLEWTREVFHHVEGIPADHLPRGQVERAEALDPHANPIDEAVAEVPPEVDGLTEPRHGVGGPALKRQLQVLCTAIDDRGLLVSHGGGSTGAGLVSMQRSSVDP